VGNNRSALEPEQWSEASEAYRKIQAPSATAAKLAAPTDGLRKILREIFKIEGYACAKLPHRIRQPLLFTYVQAQVVVSEPTR
jgi:uncharacterized alpha-E superfamily protein